MHQEWAGRRFLQNWKYLRARTATNKKQVGFMEIEIKPHFPPRKVCIASFSWISRQHSNILFVNLGCVQTFVPFAEGQRAPGVKCLLMFVPLSGNLVSKVENLGSKAIFRLQTPQPVIPQLSTTPQGWFWNWIFQQLSETSRGKILKSFVVAICKCSRQVYSFRTMAALHFRLWLISIIKGDKSAFSRRHSSQQ